MIKVYKQKNNLITFLYRLSLLNQKHSNKYWPNKCLVAVP